MAGLRPWRVMMLGKGEAMTKGRYSALREQAFAGRWLYAVLRSVLLLTYEREMHF